MESASSANDPLVAAASLEARYDEVLDKLAALESRLVGTLAEFQRATCSTSPDLAGFSPPPAAEVEQRRAA